MLWEATVRLSDPILDLIKTDESLEFISLKEAINLLARKTNSSTFGVATYLLNKKVHILLNSHSRQNNYNIEATSLAIDQDHWCGENDCYFWLNYIAENDKHYPSFSIGDNSKYNAGCQESFWKRGEFFDLECIRSLNLLSTGEWNTLFQKQQYIWDAHYLTLVKNDVPDLIEIDSNIYVNESINFEDELKSFLNSKDIIIDGFNDNLSIQEPIGCGNPTTQQAEPNIENLNAEITWLRQENEDKNKIVVELQERIKELEALQSNEQVEIQINQPESELTPEQEIPHSRQRGNVRKIIAVLVNMAQLPSEPYTAFNMLDAHAKLKGMELPSKDTTAKWTHNSS